MTPKKGYSRKGYAQYALNQIRKYGYLTSIEVHILMQEKFGEMDSRVPGSTVSNFRKRLGVTVIDFAKRGKKNVSVLSLSPETAEKAAQELRQYLPQKKNGDCHYNGKSGYAIACILHTHFEKGGLSFSKIKEVLGKLDEKGRVPKFDAELRTFVGRQSRQTRGNRLNAIVTQGALALENADLIEVKKVNGVKTVVKKNFTLKKYPHEFHEKMMV